MSRLDEKKRRNSKLESFLKRNLQPSIYNNIRWYEAVIVREGGTLAYKQVVVSGEELYLPDTPPRTLSHLLDAHSLTHVKLVHDLPEFLRGGVRDKTTHILLRYRPPPSHLKRSSSFRASRRTRSTSRKPSTNDIDEDREMTSSEDCHASIDTRDTASLCSDISNSSSLDFIPQMDSLSTLSGDSSSLLRTNRTYHSLDESPNLRQTLATNNLLKRSNHLYTSLDGIPKLKQALGTNNLPQRLSRPEHLILATNHNLIPPLNGAKSSLRSVSPSGAKSPLSELSPTSDREFDFSSLTPTITELLNKVPGSHIHRSTTPDVVGGGGSRIPRSFSSLDSYQRSSPVMLDLPVRSCSVMEKPTLIGSTPRRSQSLNLRPDNIDGFSEEREIHLYTLSTSTLLFHLLHSLWLTATLRSTSMGSPLPVRKSSNHERSIEHAFIQLRLEVLSASSLEDQFSLLQELQQGAAKYSSVRRLCWRDHDIVDCLCGFLKQYLHIHKTHSKDPEEELQERQDELEMAALTLETLTTLLRGTQRCPLKMKVIRSNNYKCLRRLIERSMTSPELDPKYKLTCNHWLTDFRELESRAWENLPESELLRLVLEVNHAETSALYELLNSATELTWGGDMHGETHDNDDLSLATILQHAPVEGWLAYSVPQLLCLLHSDGSGPLDGCEASLTHQYCYVIAVVLNHSPRALKYATANFAEELKYYAHESVVKSRLGESCPITPHTMKHMKTIAQMIRLKDKHRSR